MWIARGQTRNFWGKQARKEKSVPVGELGKLFQAMGEDLPADEISVIFKQFDRVKKRAPPA